MSNTNPAGVLFERFHSIPLSMTGLPADPNDKAAFDYFDALVIQGGSGVKHIFISIPAGVRQFDPAVETLKELCIAQGWWADGPTPNVYYFDRDGGGAGCLSIHRVDAFEDRPEAEYRSWSARMPLAAAAKLVGLGTYVFAEHLGALDGDQWPENHRLRYD
jgi:hypothetical protein